MGSWILDLFKWLFRDTSPRLDFETLYKEWQNIVKELKDRNALLEGRIDALEKEIQDLKNTEDTQRRKNFEADHVIEAQRVQIQALQSRVAELEAHVQRLEAELSLHRQQNHNPPATA